MSDYKKKYRKYKKMARDLETQLNRIYELISKISIRINIENNPVNTNKNNLENNDSDVVAANADNGGVPQ